MVSFQTIACSRHYLSLIFRLGDETVGSRPAFYYAAGSKQRTSSEDGYDMDTDVPSIKGLVVDVNKRDVDRHVTTKHKNYPNKLSHWLEHMPQLEGTTVPSCLLICHVLLLRTLQNCDHNGVVFVLFLVSRTDRRIHSCQFTDTGEHVANEHQKFMARQFTWGGGSSHFTCCWSARPTCGAMNHYFQQCARMKSRQTEL